MGTIKTAMMAGAMLSGVMLAGAAEATVTISNTGNNTAWTVSGPAPTVSGTAVTVQNPLPQDWIANTATSSWVSVNSTGQQTPTGGYAYTTDFQAATGDSLTFQFAVDDFVSAIVLNGTNVYSGAAGIGTYNAFTTFTLTNLRGGSNNLIFQTVNRDVNNKTANPSGFRFEAAVPEPATWGMMILGFGVMGMAMRRRKQVSVSFA